MKTSLRRVVLLATVAVGSFAFVAGPASSSAGAAARRMVPANAEWTGTITAIGKGRSFTLSSSGVKYKVDYTSKTPITPKGDKPAVKDKADVTGYLKSAKSTTIEAEDIALKRPKK
ncbi:MAG: hypothetical protein ACLPQS_06345 [Acidimicrobiales bacterium]